MRPQTKKGDVAQLVEQRTENPCVSGSIPLITTTRQTISQFKILMGKVIREAKFESVLLIDDESIDNFINERVITTSYFAKYVIVKITALEGLEYLKKNIDHLPNVIFLDLNMKDHDGFWFLDQYKILVKEHPIYREKCKIIVLSSSISEEEIKKASSNPDVYKYLNKPLTESYLEAINL